MVEEAPVEGVGFCRDERSAILEAVHPSPLSCDRYLKGGNYFELRWEDEH